MERADDALLSACFELSTHNCIKCSTRLADVRSHCLQACRRRLSDITEKCFCVQQHVM